MEQCIFCFLFYKRDNFHYKRERQRESAKRKKRKKKKREKGKKESPPEHSRMENYRKNLIQNKDIQAHQRSLVKFQGEHSCMQHIMFFFLTREELFIEKMKRD